MQRDLCRIQLTTNHSKIKSNNKVRPAQSQSSFDSEQVDLDQPTPSVRSIVATTLITPGLAFCLLSSSPNSCIRTLRLEKQNEKIIHFTANEGSLQIILQELCNHCNVEVCFLTDRADECRQTPSQSQFLRRWHCVQNQAADWASGSEPRYPYEQNETMGEER
jgi:hypothetical protein